MHRYQVGCIGSATMEKYGRLLKVSSREINGFKTCLKTCSRPLYCVFHLAVIDQGFVQTCFLLSRKKYVSLQRPDDESSINKRSNTWTTI
ncbi:hypothetical protein TNIN_380711 [Trichonephila inaurata madagascariensis]|uniref:Uncharacterized protein n=1 Tax=Trichonephila inaurata madagascariensis TaxID=2747483 RepID=A0A8X7C5P2_9ARAC|nr:hypothetical protein TNIN_380711 [Trichonephila inaurata madagascariensis]